jgi:aldehyde:ferredoxin oxidoreductase
MQPILTINLTNGDIGEFEIPDDWQRLFLGGASLAGRLLYDLIDPKGDPYSPDAPLLFLAGPLTGTAGPAVGRFVVCARSPATGLWGESNCGGFWGADLRQSGYDGILITGQAAEPVYLSIIGGGSQPTQVDLRPAAHLWGQDPYEVQVALKRELNEKNLRVASIGVAGETQIPFALILCDHGRVAGRTGMGALMGSKTLKAIAVRGKGKVPVENPVAFNPMRSDANRKLRADPLSRVLHDLGSAGGADYFDYLGEMPKRYFQTGGYPEEIMVSGSHVKESILVGETTCHACVIACGRVVNIDSSLRGGSRGDRKGPEYETLVGFGPNLWLNSAEIATRLGDLCDRYGMDTISLSNTLGLAFTLFEQDAIDIEDTGGLELRWGDAEMVERLVHMTAHREGFGAITAEGARVLGHHFGREEDAIQVNGLEIAYHDPRGASGMALVYATSPRGACHNQSDYFMADVGQIYESLGMTYLGSHAGREKAANVARHQDWRTVCNALVLCYFANVPPETVVGLINAACGLDWDLDEMMRAGERAWNLKRVINNRLGLTRQNDRLPKGLLEPYRYIIGAPIGEVPDFSGMLETYYQERGWDAETGFPTPEKLNDLGLGWAVEDIWPDRG